MILPFFVAGNFKNAEEGPGNLPGDFITGGWGSGSKLTSQKWAMGFLDLT